MKASTTITHRVLLFGDDTLSFWFYIGKKTEKTCNKKAAQTGKAMSDAKYSRLCLLFRFIFA